MEEQIWEILKKNMEIFFNIYVKTNLFDKLIIAHLYTMKPNELITNNELKYFNLSFHVTISCDIPKKYFKDNSQQQKLELLFEKKLITSVSEVPDLVTNIYAKKFISESIFICNKIKDELIHNKYCYSSNDNKLNFFYPNTNIEILERYYNALNDSVYLIRPLFKELYKDLINDTCSICVKDGIAMECSHYICVPCLLKLTNNLCPLCRKNIILSPKIDEIVYEDMDVDI